MKKYKLLYILPAALLFACEPEFDDVDFNGGSADFSTTVAVGNSLSAGFQSNALSAEGQENSLPNMIAQQLKQVGGGEFTQPIIPGEAGMKGVGISSMLPPGTVAPELALKLVADCNNEVGPSPQLASNPYNGAEFFAPAGANGPFNNVSVPGAKAVHLNFQGYGSAQGNPYFARFASNPLETVVEAAMKTNHTFFQLWIGNNDVLSYATGGGDEAASADPLNSSITPTELFTSAYAQTIDSLTQMGKNIPGVVANIPYVTSIPYFTTVKWNALVLTQAQADALNAGFASYNGALDNPQVAGQIGDSVEIENRRLTFKAGANGFVFLDSDLKSAATGTGPNDTLPKYRQLKQGELITLTISQNDLKCNGLGSINATVNPPVANPITGNFVLEADEVAKIKSAIDDYNAVIKAEADAHNLAFVDANARLQELASTGIAIDGINFTSAFVTGGAFSLDGVHPSTRGYAIIANDFIAAINAKYGANVPSVVVSSYPAVEVVQ